MRLFSKYIILKMDIFYLLDIKYFKKQKNNEGSFLFRSWNVSFLIR